MTQHSWRMVAGATGLNRHALYSAVDGKRALFPAPLDAYHHERKELFLKVLNHSSRRPHDAIRDVFTFCIDQMAERNAGCLISSVAMEFRNKDEIILKRIDDYRADNICGMKRALTAASARGELNPAITPEKDAHIIVAARLEIGAKAPSDATPGELRKIFDSCIALLASGANQPHENGVLDRKRRPQTA